MHIATGLAALLAFVVCTAVKSDECPAAASYDVRAPLPEDDMQSAEAFQHRAVPSSMMQIRATMSLGQMPMPPDHDIFHMVSRTSWDGGCPECEHLIDRKHKLIMGWSPRAASAAAVTMFLENAGLYGPQDQAQFPWVHDYRVMMGSRLLPTADELKDPNFIRFKIVRDPLPRAVSQFGHQIAGNFSNRPRLQELVASVWGRGYNASSKSFVQWLDLVETLGLNFDIHTQLQATGFESAGGTYDYVCKLESDLAQCLTEINTRTHSSLKWAEHHISAVMPVDPSVDVANSPWAQLGEFMRTDYTSPHPDWQLFYKNHQVVEKVRHMYRTDFELYNYSLS